jgi:putative transcriptional regulator
MESLRGNFLIASPNLVDPNFFRSVVFLLEHNEEGAFGLILNRPSEIPVGIAIPELSEVIPEKEVLFKGGPVQENAVFFLHKPILSMDTDEWDQVIPGVCIAQNDSLFERLAEETDPSETVVRVFHGYSGWGAGQLEAEMEQNSWFISSATADLIFSTIPHSLWKTCLRRLGPTHALLAEIPEDPSLN